MNQALKKEIIVAVALTAVALGFRLFLALRLPNDEPDDGRVYALIARNILENRTYSSDTSEPFTPTYFRVPAYPVFLAGVYSVFGEDNNRAVRVIQAILDTITCWIVALLAAAWAPKSWDERRRGRVKLAGLALAAVCPFTAIYVATILTEVSTTLLAGSCALLATFALKASRLRRKLFLWATAGLAGGLATQFRPDAALFAGAAGGALVLIGLARVRARRGSGSGEKRDSLARVAGRVLAQGGALSLGFALVLAPWTIRNARVFGVFEPIAPLYANMPEDFVPRGYVMWLRTWVDREKYTADLEWPMENRPIDVAKVPDWAFDSPDERARITALFDRYNHPDAAAQPTPTTQQQPEQPGADQGDDQSDDDDSSDAEEPAEDADAVVGNVALTPEIDAGFGQIARERIARRPLRYYLAVPARRAFWMWFDTHSEYYPFQGDLFPLDDLDHDTNQHLWLPFFMLLTCGYTALCLVGCWVLMVGSGTRRWLVLSGLYIVPRFIFLTSLQNPEPRYVVEFFIVVAAVGAIGLVDLLHRVRERVRPAATVKD
jgi:hypothetical protein